MVVLLTENEEERVGELDELGDEVPPAASRHSHCLGIVRIVHRLTPERVITAPTRYQTLWKHQDNANQLYNVSLWSAQLIVIYIPIWCINIYTYLVKEPRREYDFEEVVPDHDLSEIERLSVLHQFGPKDFGEVGIGETDRQSRQWTAHQEPVVDPGVALVVHHVPIAVVRHSHK